MRLFKIEQRVYLFFRVNHYEAINKILLVKKKSGRDWNFIGNIERRVYIRKKWPEHQCQVKQKTIQFHNGDGQPQNIYKRTGKEEKIKHTRSREVEGSLGRISIYGNTDSKRKTPMSEFSADTFTSYNIWELKYATLSSHWRQPKWAVFLFNLSSHNEICIVKCLFTHRDD